MHGEIRSGNVHAAEEYSIPLPVTMEMSQSMNEQEELFGFNPQFGTKICLHDALFMEIFRQKSFCQAWHYANSHCPPKLCSTHVSIEEK